MTALTEERRTWLQSLIDLAADGVPLADDCPVCAKLATWCDECSDAGAVKDTLDAAWKRVAEANTLEDALVAYMTAFAGIAGVDLRTRLAIKRAVMPPEITPAQKEFALSAVRDGARYLLGCDAGETALKGARHAAANRIRDARTAEEIGIAMTGGAL